MVSYTKELVGRSGPDKPWAPFKTRFDFEQAELFLHHNCPDTMINSQLQLNQRVSQDAWTMKTARGMHKILAEAAQHQDTSSVSILCELYLSHETDLVVQFRSVEISVPYSHGVKSEDRTYTVFCCPALDAILSVIEDPDLHSSFIFYPERHYVLNPQTEKLMRVWTDIHTGDDWWDLQVHIHLLHQWDCTDSWQDKIGPEKVVVQMTLYSDAARLDKLSRKKVWGVWVWIGNIPKHTCMRTSGKGGPILLCFLPEVSWFKSLFHTIGLSGFEVPGKQGDDPSALANHRAHVYHSGVLEMLRSAITAAGKNGFIFDDGSASGCAAQLILSITSMDYDEV